MLGVWRTSRYSLNEQYDAVGSHVHGRPFQCQCQYPCRMVTWTKSAAGRGRVSVAEAQTRDPHLSDGG